MQFTIFLKLYDNHIVKKLAIPQTIEYLELKVNFTYNSGNSTSYDKVHESITFDKVECVNILTSTGRFIPNKQQAVRILYLLDQNNEDELEALCLEYYHD